jgi:hypothetical protein
MNWDIPGHCLLQIYCLDLDISVCVYVCARAHVCVYVCVCVLCGGLNSGPGTC